MIKADVLKCWAKKHPKIYAFLWGMPFYRKVMSCKNNSLMRCIERDGLSNFGVAVRAVDMVGSLWLYGCSYSEYNLYGFKDRGHKARKEYIGDCCRKKYYMKFNAVADMECFRNKNESYREFRQYYGRHASAFLVNEGFARFIEIIRKYGMAMVKPATASGGYGVMKVDGADLAGLKAAFEYLCKIAPDDELIIEEYVEQAPELKALHPDSLNTARIVTVLDPSGEPHVIGSIFRIGRDGKNVDNGSSGGILCDLSESGEIIKCTDKTGRDYIAHPNTGICLVGFSIPRWDEAISLVMELASRKPTTRYCGWDVALTTNGWIMIEGNESAELSVMQAFGYGYRQRLERFL